MPNVTDPDAPSLPEEPPSPVGPNEADEEEEIAPPPPPTGSEPPIVNLPSRCRIVDERGSPNTLAGSPMLLCFAGPGLASTIIGHLTVRRFNLPRIATVRSPLLPSNTVVIDGRPNPPVRIYGSSSMAVVLSEFPAPGPFAQPFAEALLEWADRKKVGLILSVEGVFKETEADSGPAQFILGAGTTDSADALLEEAQVPLLAAGVIGGLTAELVNLATLVGRSVVFMFASTTEQEYPDAAAADRLAEALDRIIPGLKLEPPGQAEVVESLLKKGLRFHKAYRPNAGEPATAFPGGSSFYG